MRFDLPAILDLWKRTGTEPGHTDDIESLTKLITRDPGALLVAVEDETIAGSVIAAWDGWRGSIYRLAAAPSHRRRGLGTVLVNAAVCMPLRVIVGLARVHGTATGGGCVTLPQAARTARIAVGDHATASFTVRFRRTRAPVASISC